MKMNRIEAVTAKTGLLYKLDVNGSTRIFLSGRNICIIFCALLSGFLFCKLEKLAYCLHPSMLKAKTQSRSFTEIDRVFKSIDDCFVKVTRRSWTASMISAIQSLIIIQLTLALVIYANGEIFTACSGNLVCAHLIHHFFTNQRNKATMP